MTDNINAAGITKPNNLLFKTIIFGEPCSKANSRKLVPNKKTGRIFSIKSDAGRKYVDSFLLQINNKRKIFGLCSGIPKKPIDCKVILFCVIYYATERKDLDESLVMDCLEKSGIIKNDRLIRQKHVYHFIDKFNPRSEIELFERVV